MEECMEVWRYRHMGVWRYLAIQVGIGRKVCFCSTCCLVMRFPHQRWGFCKCPVETPRNVATLQWQSTEFDKKKGPCSCS